MAGYLVYANVYMVHAVVGDVCAPNAMCRGQCLFIGGASVCTKACTAPGDCPAPTTCSDVNWITEKGAREVRKFCIKPVAPPLVSLADAANVADAADAASSAECTLATPLVSGVPGSPGHLVPSERNPNGASELALLMRSMLEDTEAAKTAIVDNRALPPLWSRHRKMRCAWPTEPSDRNAAFDARAADYLARLRELETATTSRRDAYKKVVAACRGCHETTCSGVLDTIDKLKLDDGKAGASP